jgi:hypothetical protein
MAAADPRHTGKEADQTAGRHKTMHWWCLHGVNAVDTTHQHKATQGKAKQSKAKPRKAKPRKAKQSHAKQSHNVVQAAELVLDFVTACDTDPARQPLPLFVMDANDAIIHLDKSPDGKSR